MSQQPEASGPLQAALSYYDKELFVGSLFYIRQAIQQNPADSRGWELLSLVTTSQQERLNAAFHAYQLNPASADLHALQSLRLLEIGKRDEAKIAYEYALTLEPNNLRGRRAKARYFQEMGQVGTALGEVNSALAIGAEKYLMQLKISMLNVLKRPSETFVAATALVNTFPTAASSYSYLAFALLLLGQYPEALNESQRALGLTQESDFVWTQHGWTCMGNGRKDLARYAFERALALAPEDANARGGLRQALM